MREKIKFYTYVIGSTVLLPFIACFFIYKCGGDTIDLFTGSDVIYFDWKGIPIIFFMLLLIDIEMAVISCLFTKDKKVNPLVMAYVNKIGIYIGVFFFISIISGPIINIALAFTSYHPCASSGIFSGVYYVKDKTKCYGLTGVIPWGKGYGYVGDEKK